SLVDEPFIVRERGSDTWNSMEEGFAGRLKPLNIAMEITSTETIKQAVIAGMGISFLSAHTVSMELQIGRLAVLDIEGFPVMLNWYLVHRHNKRLPAVAMAFKQFLIDEGAAQISAITHIG
ncbi:MAG: LysR family transcriptional regulator, low CO2-responsive transcriptional regulator, partial [Caballeronia sp.]|nr:LysR family transcriptional regulator, low CO2-responsive transcriptional regulator [Caballeronia sp.]